MNLNVKHARDTIAYIKAHPDEHKQESYVCGTGMCFAGHSAVSIGGAQQLPNNPELVVYDPEIDIPDDIWSDEFDGVISVHLSDRSTNLLLGKDCTYTDRSAIRALYSGGNTIEQIENRINYLEAKVVSAQSHNPVS